MRNSEENLISCGACLTASLSHFIQGEMVAGEMQYIVLAWVEVECQRPIVGEKKTSGTNFVFYK